MVPGFCKLDLVLLEREFDTYDTLEVQKLPKLTCFQIGESKISWINFCIPCREILDKYTDIIIFCKIWTSKMIQVTQMYQTSSKSVFYITQSN